MKMIACGIFADSLKNILSTLFAAEYSYEDAIDVLKMDLTSMTTIWPTITNVYNNAILPVALSLIFLYFWMELIEKATSNNFSIEVMVRLFIKMIVAYVLCKYGLQLFGYVVQFGAALVGDIANAATTNSAGVDSSELDSIIDAYIASTSWATHITQIIVYLLPYLVSQLVGVIIIIQCWSRNINLLVRVMFAPIALADMFNDGPRAQGFMYIRKVLAVAIQGAIMLGVLIAGTAVETMLLPNLAELNFDIGLPTAFKLVGFQFLLIGLLQGTGPIANEIMGVH